MCGIFLCVCDESDSSIKKILQNETIQFFLSRRGPDHFEKQTVDCTLGSETKYDQNVRFTFLSSVLQLRGCFVCNQPVRTSDGSVLQWNGQIFDGFSHFDPNVSDTEQLLLALTYDSTVDHTLNVISSINGPWAFTFWDNRCKRLWVGRDILGRRSLCWNTTRRDQMLLLSSVAHIQSEDALFSTSSPLAEISFEEIPTQGVYCFDFSAYSRLSDVIKNVQHYQWNRSISGKLVGNNPVFKTLKSPIEVPINMTLPDPQLDALLASGAGQDQSSPPKTVPAFIINSFCHILSEAVRVRCKNHHNVCRKCFARYVKHNERQIEQSYSSDSESEVRSGVSTVNGITFRECSHASTAILFSGGLDSTVVALLADRFVPIHLPIDLLNVAFNNDAPDRETGLSAWNELRALCPSRKWNFVSIHISKEELEAYRAKHIRFLVKPSCTVLDDSIGCAVWFAARGEGLLLQETGVASSYKTRARVVLLGMGADEQLAGYSRHRKAFLQGGWQNLLDEITVDVERISSRNLGRDDRVTADHGIEARFPFLDEKVINFLNGQLIWHKCNLYLERSSGEKLLLRLLAERLGLRNTAHHRKRAIQFGSRIAKLEERGEKGDDICQRLVCKTAT